MADSPLIWEEGGPRSSLFGDIYYSLENGLAESRAVFLAGCGLPDAWAGRRRFTVGELGFGTGLNIAALLHLWRRTRPPGGRLHIFSIEGFPAPREDAARALAAWPEIAEEAAALLDRWPGVRRGLHRLELPEFDAVLDLALLDVETALDRWQGRADAWFLDGFSPALNPDMWREEIMARIGARSAPGAVCATFTVAGFVRRGLEAAGFSVERRPGYGRKLQRLEAKSPGEPVEMPAPSVAIIGGGIAGASLARAFRAEGVEPLVIASGAPAASGNPAALVTPGLDAGDPVRARLYAESFARAVQLYEKVPEALIHEGAYRLATQPRDAARHRAVADQDIFEPRTVQVTDDGGLRFEEGVVVEPERVLARWFGAMETAEVKTVEAASDGWRIRLAGGGDLCADVVIVAAGGGSGVILPGLQLQSVRGQASWSHETPWKQAITFGAYAIPTRTGILFGATHDKADSATDLRAEDHARNLASLARGLPDLAARLAGDELDGRAAIRAATPDRLPVAGEVAPGLFVLGGLGSRGFTTAPLLAEHIAATVLGIPSPLAADVAVRLAPVREQGRAGSR